MAYSNIGYKPLAVKKTLGDFFIVYSLPPLPTELMGGVIAVVHKEEHSQEILPETAFTNQLAHPRQTTHPRVGPLREASILLDAI